MPTVIVSAPLPGNALDQLRRNKLDVVMGDSPYGLGIDGILSELQNHPDTVALISLLSDRIDERILKAAPALRIVANYAVGIDNISLDQMKTASVIVTNTPGVLTNATADLTMGLLLDACRNISRGDRLIRAEMWRGWSPSLLVGKRVTNATLGIIGLGRIGQAVAQRARGFGMKIVYHQRHSATPRVEADLEATRLALNDLLHTSDIVSLHCPLTEQTRGLIGREQLQQMQPGAVLINTARGACVDETALVDVLKSGHLAAAGLDVFPNEPNVSRELLTLPNVSLAPHLGSADETTRGRMAEMCVENILAVLRNEEPPNRVV